MGNINMDSTILQTIFYISVILKITIVLHWLFKHLMMRQRLKIIPGPKSYPLVGNLPEVLRLHVDDHQKWITKTSFQYKNGMFVVWIGTSPRINLRKPQQLEVILPSSKLIQKSMIYDQLKNWLGEGLLTSNGEMWHHQRRMITPAFHFGVLSEFADHMSQKAEVMNECIANSLKKNPGQPINIFDFALRCTLESICETAMGINEDMQHKTDNAYVKAVQKFAKLASERLVRPWYKSNFIYYKTKGGKEYRETIKIMHDFTLKVIHQKQAERANSKNNTNTEVNDDLIGKKRKAFLDLLLDASESAETPLTTKEIREQVDTFMFAGHDTTAAAISWTLFALGNNIDIQDKVHEEIDEVFGNSDDLITQKQLSQLKYLDRVIKEGLRMYPSAPVISRLLTQDTMIDGVMIPKNMIILMHIMHLHNDPDIWENPTKFDPDRFLPENSHNRHPYAYIPFSAGPRNCIGQKFALLELKIVLATVLRQWKVRSLLKPDEIETVSQIILRPRGNIDLFFTPRK